MPSPFVPQGEDIREGFYEIEHDLFIKLSCRAVAHRALGEEYETNKGVGGFLWETHISLSFKVW